jgi:4-diphosphocytidyl-2-C-methyl-D-erythritol kinase
VSSGELVQARRQAFPPSGLSAAESELARAKVNLTLEIKGRRPDGYHELESLVLFADFGDRIEWRPAGSFSLEITGPFASALDGPNLVERAVRAHAELVGCEPGGAFRLVKHLPVAAGLGGGSADAAAVLRILIATSTSGAPDPAALHAAATRIGADIPCCLASSAAIMTGIGDNLHQIRCAEPAPAVLVNPMVPLATRDVFRELAAPPLSLNPAPPLIPDIASVADLAIYARARRNDLQAPAQRMLPVIGEVLAALDATPGALLSRLSGSGPTCFALFTDAADALAAARAIASEHPGWWVRAVALS